jgi:hypothetical protein
MLCALRHFWSHTKTQRHELRCHQRHCQSQAAAPGDKLTPSASPLLRANQNDTDVTREVPQRAPRNRHPELASASMLVRASAARGVAQHWMLRRKGTLYWTSGTIISIISPKLYASPRAHFKPLQQSSSLPQSHSPAAYRPRPPFHRVRARRYRRPLRGLLGHQRALPLSRFHR